MTASPPAELRVAIDGLPYAVERAGSGPPVVVLHGFTGDAAAMRDVTAPLRERYDVCAIDLPGHGASFHAGPPERFALARVADDLVRVAARLGIPCAAWFGYSLGGRTALALAAAHRDAVRGLVLLGASAGIADAAERARRRTADDELAARIERDGIGAFVDRWEALPLFATQAQRLSPERAARQRATRLRNDPRGLAASLRGMGAGAQAPLHAVLGSLAVPALVLAGADDATYCARGAELAAALPDATFAAIPGAGHAAHLEAPEAVVAAAGAFLDRLHVPTPVRGVP